MPGLRSLRTAFLLMTAIVTTASAAGIQYETGRISLTPLSSFNSVAYGEGVFVAVGFSGIIARSSDGIQWTQVNSGISSALRGVAYGNQRFVAVGDNSMILGSPDGISWTNHNHGVSGTCTSVHYGGGLWIVTSSSLRNRLVTSTSGVDWVIVNADSSDFIRDIVFHNGTWVAAGTLNGAGFMRTSADGLNWQTRAAMNGWFGGVTHFNNRFIAVAQNPKMAVSPDAVNWTEVTAGCYRDFVTGSRRIASNSNHIIIVGYSGGVLHSTDGISWTCDTADVGNAELYAVAAGSDRFVAVGSGGMVVSIRIGATRSRSGRIAGPGDPVASMCAEENRIYSLRGEYLGSGNARGITISAGSGSYPAHARLTTSFRQGGRSGPAPFPTVRQEREDAGNHH